MADSGLDQETQDLIAELRDDMGTLEFYLHVRTEVEKVRRRYKDKQRRQRPTHKQMNTPMI